MTVLECAVGNSNVDLINTQSVVKHPIRSTIQHWQLRDLIACPSSRNEVIYVCGNNVNTFNTVSRTSSVLVKDLNFPPTCLTTGSGYLVVGGQRSQLLVRELNSNWFFQQSVGGCINNSLLVATHSNNQNRLLVMNNDETIKVFTLPTMHRVTSITFPTAVNYAAMSPDGSKLVAVGDSNQVFMYDVTASGTYAKSQTLVCPGSSAGFSCSWNSGSDKFAIASQDGIVQVYDFKNLGAPLASFFTVNHHSPDKGAARCIKFSPFGSMDLLAFTQHVSYIHFVDARSFTSSQVVRVAPPNVDQHIAGFCFSPDSRSVFVGLETALVELDVNCKGRRSFPSGAIL